MQGPVRAQLQDVLSGPSRLYVKARTAPAAWSFTVWLTREQMEAFEGWYRTVLAEHEGEFYARWIGGSRVVAFASPYEYRALGRGWSVSATVVRTRIDPSACDAYINAAFGNILRDDGVTADVLLADLTSTNIWRDDYSLELIADNEC